MDSIVLNYFDSLLHESDVALLSGPFWLNDKIIGFCFEYFENESFKPSSDKLKFLNPSIVQLVKLVEDSEVSSILQPLNLQSSQLIFIPINDNSTLYPGGSHWSLLVCDKISETFFHFDSSGVGCWNESSAKIVSNKFNHVFGTSFDVINPQCPTQKNGYDCGVFVVAIAEKLAGNFSRYARLEFTDLSDVNQLTVKAKRKAIKRLIREIAKR